MLRVAAAVLLLSFSASVQAEADAKPDYPAAGPPSSYGAPPAPAPSYGPPPAPAPSYGPPPAPSYGPPPKPKSYCHKKCYDKTVYTTITKTAKEHHTSWMTQNQVPSSSLRGFCFHGFCRYFVGVMGSRLIFFFYLMHTYIHKVLLKYLRVGIQVRGFAVIIHNVRWCN